MDAKIPINAYYILNKLWTLLQSVWCREYVRESNITVFWIIYDSPILKYSLLGILSLDDEASSGPDGPNNNLPALTPAFRQQAAIIAATVLSAAFTFFM